MKTIGLMGGAGSGKSFLAAYLKNNYNAVVIDGDGVGHRLLDMDEDIKKAIVDIFGPTVSDSDGNIDRKSLGSIVFGDKSALSKLNKIMHPAMKTAISSQIRALNQDGTDIAVLDAAVMIEAGFLDLVDFTIYITADESIRLNRLTGPRGIENEKALNMIASGREDYGRYADYTLDSSGGENVSYNQLDDIMKDILEENYE